jgi:hypothetical protein
MATANNRRIWPGIIIAIAVLCGTLVWLNRAPIWGYTHAGAAFGARTACSCRYVAGRGLKDCHKDFEPGMAAVFLSDDPENKSVTAYVPLMASETARFRPGYGCLLDRWPR